MPRRILIVDHQCDVAESLARLLDLMGHEVIYITDARQALGLARSFAPHVVFLNLDMLHVHGYELARAMRESRELESTRLVAMSAGGVRQQGTSSGERRFDAHIEKPASVDLLRSMLSRFRADGAAGRDWAHGKPRVLLAARAEARHPFRAALGDMAELIDAETLETAVRHLESREPPAVVCSTLHFDESKMFDLLKWAHARCRHIPFVCARALSRDSRISPDPIRIAVQSLGAAFLDLPTLVVRHGQAKAEQTLRLAVLNAALAG